MNLVVVRHGQTFENVEGLLQGHARGSLTDLGKQQSQETALLLKNESFDAIYSSDLERCVDTTNYLIKYHQKTPTYYTADLRELDLGKLDKLPIGIPDVIQKTAGQIVRFFHLKLPGVESLKAVRLRLAKFLDDVYEKYPSGNILIVSHGLAIRSIEAVLSGAGNTDINPIPNCEVLRLTMTKPVG